MFYEGLLLFRAVLLCKNFINIFLKGNHLKSTYMF